MILRTPTEHENGGIPLHILIFSTRHSRDNGNPGWLCAELAWIPALAGMTDPGRLFIVRIATYVFSKEDTKMHCRGESQRGRFFALTSSESFASLVLLADIISEAWANFSMRKSQAGGFQPGADDSRYFLRVLRADRPEYRRRVRPFI